MRAVFIKRYGGTEVLEYGERPRPVLKSGQVLVEVHAASVNPRDWLLREGRYVFRWLTPRFPLILGSDISGVVVEAGSSTSPFRLGDAVFGMQTTLGGMGAYAEYIAIAGGALARKPSTISHEEAAAVPCAALTAYRALTQVGHVSAGTQVTIIGASGGMGSYATQLARARGATVVAVTSGRNASLVESLGADRVIDYTTVPFATTVRSQDLVFDTVGRESLRTCSPVLGPRGRYVTTIPGLETAWESLTSNLWRALRAGNARSAHVVLVRADGQALERIASLMSEGKVRSIIDSVYPLSEARAAHEKSRSRRTRGKLILQVRT